MLSKLFRGSGAAEAAGSAGGGERVPRRSNGLMELSRSLRGEEGMRVLDPGPTSPQNIAYFTGLGHRIHNEDVLRAASDPSLVTTGESGETSLDVTRFLAENLSFDKEFFDAVLCWDTADYLPADLVKPVVERIHRVLKPKGLLLAFFHTKDAGPDAPYQRYHIASADTLELQRIVTPASKRSETPRQASFRLQRAFNNRHIENLFHDYASIKFFLGRDNIREVLVVR